MPVLIRSRIFPAIWSSIPNARHVFGGRHTSQPFWSCVERDVALAHPNGEGSVAKTVFGAIAFSESPVDVR